MREKQRIDKLLVDHGLAGSQARAQALVMAGVVLADERRVEKPSELFSGDAAIRIKDRGIEARYVSRGGLKLEAALKHFSVDPRGFTCIDIGSSTGGFTDCLLQHGAASVTAVDSGTNQLVWKLREDPRIRVLERTNARDLNVDGVGETFDLAVMDVSFISVTKILPAIPGLVKKNGQLIVLIKPQFEVAKGEVGKGGVVREPEKHERVVIEVNAFAAEVGFFVRGVIDSPITGAEGNKEFLAVYDRRT